MEIKREFRIDCEITAEEVNKFITSCPDVELHRCIFTMVALVYTDMADFRLSHYSREESGSATFSGQVITESHMRF